MSCPTCDHTMQPLCAHFFWCSRCGTIQNHTGRDVEAPKLVERCREFAKLFPHQHKPMDAFLSVKWAMTGIAESIHQPGNRT